MTWCSPKRWASSRLTRELCCVIRASSGRWSFSGRLPTSPVRSWSKISPTSSPHLVRRKHFPWKTPFHYIIVLFMIFPRNGWKSWGSWCGFSNRQFWGRRRSVSPFGNCPFERHSWTGGKGSARLAGYHSRSCWQTQLRPILPGGHLSKSWFQAYCQRAPRWNTKVNLFLFFVLPPNLFYSPFFL